MLDLIVRGGVVTTGADDPRAARTSGSPGAASRPSATWRVTVAGRTLDATGLAVTPGFIDAHTHSEFTLYAHPECGQRGPPGGDHPHRRQLRVLLRAPDRSRPGPAPDLRLRARRPDRLGKPRRVLRRARALGDRDQPGLLRRPRRGAGRRRWASTAARPRRPRSDGWPPSWTGQWTKARSACPPGSPTHPATTPTGTSCGRSARWSRGGAVSTRATSGTATSATRTASGRSSTSPPRPVCRSRSPTSSPSSARRPGRPTGPSSRWTPRAGPASTSRATCWSASGGPDSSPPSSGPRRSRVGSRPRWPGSPTRRRAPGSARATRAGAWRSTPPSITGWSWRGRRGPPS